MKVVFKRLNRQTPSFFKKVRNVGLTLAAIGTAVVAAPVVSPAIIVQVANYLIVAGAVAGAVSQTAVTNDKK